MTTTATNNFDKTVKSLKVTGTLHVDKIKIKEEWIPYTPTFTNFALGSPSTSKWVYKIVGHQLFVKGYFTNGAGGTAGNAAYTISLPTGCAGTTALLGLDGACGDALLIGSTVQYQGTVQFTNASTGVVIKTIDTATPTATILVTWGTNATTHADLRANDANLQLYVNFSVMLSPTCAALTGINP
jgi:hypothetical protein